MPYKFEYFIEKGFPIPEAEEIKLPLKQMEIGDSFFVPLLDWVSMGLIDGRSAIWILLNTLSPKHREYKVRTVCGGYRIWRTK